LSSQPNHLALQLAGLKSVDEFVLNPDGLTFIVAKSGAGQVTARTATVRLAPGEIMVVNGSGGGKIGVQDKGEFHFWIFSLCFENLLPLFSGNEISLLHNITDGYKTPKIYPASHALAAECAQLLAAVPERVNLDHRGQLIRIASSILAVEFNEAQVQRSGFVRAEDHMVQVFERLSPTEFINLSVGELAEKFSCSRRHLNRLFHQYFGVSVATLRMEMRLLKAMSLLRDPDAKVINVAEQCGFNHLGLFNTCFKRRFGTSPGQWRKSNLNAPREIAPVRKTDQITGCPLHSSGLCLWGGKAEGVNTAPPVGAHSGRLPSHPAVSSTNKRSTLEGRA
jgi:AraC-like DNA-binding protein